MPVTTILAAILLLTMSAAATADDANVETGAVQLIRITDGIYAVAPNFAGANGALILGESGHIVVDTHGTPASAQALIDAVAAVSEVPIRYVVNTHWHVDHHSGNAAYRAAFGPDVMFISHDDTRTEIPTLGAEQFKQVAAYRSMPIAAADKALDQSSTGHGEPLSAEQIAAIKKFRDAQQEYAAKSDYEYVLADLTYSDSVTLHNSPHTVEIFFLHSAHTRSDSIVYVPQQEVLIVGDLLTKPILWSWSSYPAQYVQTLKGLEALPVKSTVIGHGGPVLEGKAYLTQVRQFLETAVEYSAKSRAAGLSAEEATAAAASDIKLQAFRRQFVSAEQDSMFDQMVGWTIARAYQEN